MMKIVALVCMLAVVVASEEVDIRPTPVFLVGASNGIKKAFYDIISKDWTSEQKGKAIDDFVAKLDSKFQAAYAKFKQDIAVIKAKYGQSVDDQVNT
ncbi:unnamed protein product [Enterobius vermicularis]|uniref:Apolipoprotein C-I n=1 Tax=Enterobius vermicularis TaxID=51028 RepID=A0A0N4UYZ9_ENTVE|nr:unnamed protein product [Enterobius vermicularis]